MTFNSCSNNEQTINVETIIFDEKIKNDIKDEIISKIIPLKTTDESLL